MRILDSNPFSSIINRAQSQRTDSKEMWNSFGAKLQTAIDEVDDLKKQSDQLTQDAVLGRVENLHDVMIAAEKASTAMNLTLEVRGKVLEAYKEIMRMQF